jgi:hypothetical protein
MNEPSGLVNVVVVVVLLLLLLLLFLLAKSKVLSTFPTTSWPNSGQSTSPRRILVPTEALLLKEEKRNLSEAARCVGCCCSSCCVFGLLPQKPKIDAASVATVYRVLTTRSEYRML